MRFGRTVSDRSLRPVRWPGRPGRHTLLRVGLVAALLGLAVAVLDSPPGCPAPTGRAGRAAQPSPATGQPDRTADRAPQVGRDGGAGPADPDVPPGSPPGRALPLPAGTVGVPVRLAEPAALAVLRPGHRVDLLAVRADAPSAGAALIASRVLVLDVVGADDPDHRSALYLALPPEPAHRAVGLAEGSRFAVVVRD